MIMDCFNVGYAFHANQTVDDLATFENFVSVLQSESLSAPIMSSPQVCPTVETSYYFACEASDLFRAIAL